MSINGIFDSPHWYAIQTKPRQEVRAASNLEAWNVETFAPKILERRPGVNAFSAAYSAKPLFPQYIFARFKARDLLYKICFTRGVKRVVCFGDDPTPVDDEIINLIKSRSDKGGFVKTVEDLLPGDRIIVNNGYLKDFAGIFERYMKGRDRVAILLNTINFQGRLVIEREWVKKAG